MSRRLQIAAGLILLALLTWARVRLIDSLPDQGYFAKYTIVADQILAGRIPRDRLLDFSPLYLWFVVAMRAIGAGFRAIRTLQIVLVSAGAVLVALAARRFGLLAVIAAPILLLGSRGALVCATEVEPETLILVLNAGALACLVEDSRPRLSDCGGPLSSTFSPAFSSASPPRAGRSHCLWSSQLRLRCVHGA